MGPQLVRCGMTTTATGHLKSARGFNGAATCSLRNAGGSRPPSMLHDALQWGRNLFVAECSGTIDRDTGESLLQWGRNLFVAECYSDVRLSLEQIGFNGAATCSLRNVVRRHR